MKLYTYLAINLIFVAGCYNSSKLNNDSYIKIGIYRNTQFVNPSGNIVPVIDTVYMINYENYLLYLLSTQPLKLNENSDSAIFGALEYSNFIVKKKEQSGRYYKNFSDTTYTIYSTDSILISRGLQEHDMYPILKTVKFKNNKKVNNSIINEYAILSKSDANDYDTVKFYYNNKLNNITFFSFSRKLDSIENAKLWKFEIITNQYYSTTYKLLMPRREIMYQMEKLPIEANSPILTFLERIQKEY